MMKNIIKYSLMLLACMGLLTACEDDNASNPSVVPPTTFVLNQIPIQGNVDLEHSESINLSWSQPDYGFPALTQYEVQVSTHADMTGATTIKTVNSVSTDIEVARLASTLTAQLLAEDETLTEDDFPKVLPVYFRVVATMVAAESNKPIPGTSINSNIVSIDNVRLLYSLPPVELPTELFIAGSFNGGSWDQALEMAMVYGTDNVFWHLVYIDEDGIQVNNYPGEDEDGIATVSLDLNGDLSANIAINGTKITTETPGWYLMIVTTSVVDREIVYEAKFNKPEVWMMGPITPQGNWSELEEGCMFSVPEGPDGEFVSPPFAAGVPGGDGDGVRAYVKIPGYDWWKSEFMVYNDVIAYRGTGPDQNAAEADGGFGYRVAGEKGQCMYFNFTEETGRIAFPEN